MKLLLLVCAVWVGWWVASVDASVAPIWLNVTACGILSANTNYVLISDITEIILKSQSCITLGANSVFDGNGHVINTRTGQGNGVYANSASATIKNIVIKGFDTGIFFDNGCLSCTMFNNTISNVTTYGISSKVNANISSNTITSISGKTLTVYGISQTTNTDIGNIESNTVSGISGATAYAIYATGANNFWSNTGYIGSNSINTISGTITASGIFVGENSVDVRNNSVISLTGPSVCGICVAGTTGTIQSNFVNTISGDSAIGIYQNGNYLIANNRISLITGSLAAGIDYDASGGFGYIQNNSVNYVTFPNSCVGQNPQVVGIAVNMTGEGINMTTNLIQNIGGGGGCGTTRQATASGIVFIVNPIALYYFSTTPSVLLYNTISLISGGTTGGDARGFACTSTDPWRGMGMVVNNISTVTAHVNGTAIGIDAETCSMASSYNTIDSISGARAYGIYGYNFNYFAISNTNITGLTSTTVNATIGMSLTLPNSVLLYNLTMSDNYVDNSAVEKYYIYHIDPSSDVCGKSIEYQGTNQMCFPPGSGCCSTECLPICAPGECDSSCKPLAFNCTDCDCGDGVCSKHENCSSCSADCPCPSICFDRICGPGENCSTCPADCGRCGQQYTCPNNCSENGVCVENGICQCFNNYNGPSCDRVNTNFTFDTNPSYPGTVISYFNPADGITYKFNISIDLIREVTFTGENVRNYSLADVTFNSVPLWLLSLVLPEVEFHKSLLGVLPNGAIILFTLVTIEKRIDVPFGFINISVPPQAMKYNFQIWYWPFLSIFNHLEVYANQYVTSPDFANDTYVDGYGNVRYQNLRDPATNASLFINIPPYIIIFGQIQRMEVQQTPLGVAMIVPFFLGSVSFDPDYSVLLGSGSSTSNTGASTKPSNNVSHTSLIIGLCVSIGVLVLVVIAIIIIYPRVRLRNQIRRDNQSQKGQTEMSPHSDEGESLTVRM